MSAKIKKMHKKIMQEHEKPQNLSTKKEKHIDRGNQIKDSYVTS